MNYKLSVVVPVLTTDDGSTDGTSEAIHRLTQKFHQIVAYEKSNGGFSDARNFGFGEASGRLCVLFDSDDYLTTQVQRWILNQISLSALIYYNLAS